MTDRDLILGRIRRGLGRGDGRALIHEEAQVSRPVDLSQTLPSRKTKQELADEFRREAELQSVTVHESPDPAGAARALGDLLDRLDAKRVFTWNDPLLVELDMPRILQESGTEDLTPRSDDTDYPPDRSAHKALAAKADVGITAVDWALADTGTLVLLSGRDHSRSASLLPPVHVAVLSVSRILADLGELAERLPVNPAEALERESNVTLITGTSKTADIELTLVRGIHGPARVHVIVIRDDNA